MRDVSGDEEDGYDSTLIRKSNKLKKSREVTRVSLESYALSSRPQQPWTSNRRGRSLTTTS